MSSGRGFDIGPGVKLNAETVRYVFLTSEEACCDQNKIRGHGPLRSFHRNHVHPAGLLIFLRFERNKNRRFDIALPVFFELFDRCLVNAGISSELPDRFLLAVVGL